MGPAIRYAILALAHVAVGVLCSAKGAPVTAAIAWVGVGFCCCAAITYWHER